MEIGTPENSLIAVLLPYRKRAFSLIEVLLVLALVGVLLGIVAGNAGAFLSGSNFEQPERVLKKAVLDAVYRASESKEARYIDYSEGNASFLLRNSGGEVLSVHAVYKEMNSEIRKDPKLIPKVSFYAVGPMAVADGGAGSSKYEGDELLLERVRFHYSSMTPFYANIVFKDNENYFLFDPFSGYLVKDEK